MASKPKKKKLSKSKTAKKSIKPKTNKKEGKQSTSVFLKNITSLLSEKKIVLVLIDSNKYTNNLQKIAKYLVTTKKLNCLYISFNKPYKTISQNFKKSGVNLNKFYFIDLVSQMIGTKTQENEKNVLFVESPSNLTLLGIAITEAFKKMDSKKSFVLLDSLSTLAVYNAAKSVSFAHFFVSKLRAADIMGVMMTIESETDAKIVQKISAFVDEKITLKGGD